jgi:hypothetical protein
VGGQRRSTIINPYHAQRHIRRRQTDTTQSNIVANAGMIANYSSQQESARKARNHKSAHQSAIFGKRILNAKIRVLFYNYLLELIASERRRRKDTVVISQNKDIHAEVF